MLKRKLDISKELKPGKVLLILGPRRVGKTTLLQEFMRTIPEKDFLFFRGDDLSAQRALESPDSTLLLPLVGEKKYLFIDEAQDIPNIGQTLKLIVDILPSIQILATGSSAFELNGQIGEPLTGRKITKHMYGLSQGEIQSNSETPRYIDKNSLENYMIYGTYPSVLTSKTFEEKQIQINEIVNSYLLRDILAYKDIKGARIIIQLLTLIAHQIGSEVSMVELAGKLQIDKNTVARYLDLLEKSYILFRLGGFSRNMRSEVTKYPKYYFYDLGIRNGVIENFNAIEKRDDVGKLWENYCVIERLKFHEQNNIFANHYFWRTWEQSEIDLVEESDGILRGYEIKWNTKLKASAPKQWTEAYGDKATWQEVNPSNFLDFVS